MLERMYFNISYHMPMLLAAAKKDTMDIGDAEKLVTPIFDGAISVFNGWVEDLLQAVVSWMTGSFTPTSDYFYTSMGIGDINNSFFNFFYAVAYFILIAVFLVNLLALTMQGFNDQKNSLIELLIRFVFSCIFVSLCRIIFDNMAHWAQDIFDIIPTDIEHDVQSGAFAQGIINIAVDKTVIVGLIKIIFFLAIIIEFIKLILEIIERYIVCELLKITAPIYCGMFVSRTTSSIAMNGIRMYISQLFLLLMNQFFAIAACAMISHFDHTVLGYLLVIAFLKTAQRIDAHMKSMGLTVAQTGSAFLGSIAGAVTALQGLGSVAKKGAGIASASMAGTAVATNNPDLMKASQKLGAFSKSGVAGAIAPIGEGETIKELVSKGGGSNVPVSSGKKAASVKKSLENTATKAFSQGAYSSVAQLDKGTQTAVARNILGGKNADNKSLFAAATGGFNASDIKEARIAADGTITGTVEKDGKTFDFTASTRNSNGEAVSMTGTDDKSYFIATSGDNANIMGEAAGKFELTKDGQSNLSSMVDFDVDDQRLASMGASTYSCEDNVLTVRDDKGNAIYQHSLTTGNEIYGGVDAYAGNGQRKELINDDFDGVFNEASFDANGSLAGMIDGNIQPGSGTYHRDSNMYSFKTTTGDVVRISGVSNQGFSTLNKNNAKIVDLGNRGSYTITQTRVKSGPSGGSSGSSSSAGNSTSTASGGSSSTSSGGGSGSSQRRTTTSESSQPRFDSPTTQSQSTLVNTVLQNQLPSTRSTGQTTVVTATSPNQTTVVNKSPEKTVVVNQQSPDKKTVVNPVQQNQQVQFPDPKKAKPKKGSRR